MACPRRRDSTVFTGSLRYSGALDVDESLASWERPEGPMAVPGEYVAELVRR